LSGLIRLAVPFGLNERLVRTATAAAWRRKGGSRRGATAKLSEYRLSKAGPRAICRRHHAHLWRPLDQLDRPLDAGCAGRPCGPRIGKTIAKKNLSGGAFGELSNGVFAHPEAQANEVALRTLRTAFAGPIRWSSMRTSPTTSRPGRVGGTGPGIWLTWASATGASHNVSRRALDPLRRMPIEPESRVHSAQPCSFTNIAGLHLRDPLLPQSLLPANWPGNPRRGTLRGDLRSRIRGVGKPISPACASRFERPIAPARPHRDAALSAASTCRESVGRPLLQPPRPRSLRTRSPENASIARWSMVNVR